MHLFCGRGCGFQTIPIKDSARQRSQGWAKGSSITSSYFPPLFPKDLRVACAVPPWEPLNRPTLIPHYPMHHIGSFLCTLQGLASCNLPTPVQRGGQIGKVSSQGAAGGVFRELIHLALLLGTHAKVPTDSSVGLLSSGGTARSAAQIISSAAVFHLLNLSFSRDRKVL